MGAEVYLEKGSQPKIRDSSLNHNLILYCSSRMAVYNLRKKSVGHHLNQSGHRGQTFADVLMSVKIQTVTNVIPASMSTADSPPGAGTALRSMNTFI